MVSGDGTMRGSGGGPELNWNQSHQGGFIGPIPPDNGTMDLTQDEGNDQPRNENNTEASNRKRDRNSDDDGHNNRDRSNRNRDRDNRGL